ncbi:MAG: DUF6629 family protein [Candidatus Woesearchaeota archaeon]
MCFSAQASFIASSFLLFVGILNLKINKRKDLKVLSVMPLLFSIQQFFEGILWLTLGNEIFPLLQTFSKVTFLIFAILIWPMYVSSSLIELEKGTIRKKVLKVIYKFSIIWTISAAIYMVIHEPTAEICKSHISYSVPLSGLLGGIATISYLILTIPPYFITSNKKLWGFGVIISITATIAYIFYNAYFTSVWCYFAAIASMFILVIIKEENK